MQIFTQIVSSSKDRYTSNIYFKNFSHCIEHEGKTEIKRNIQLHYNNWMAKTRKEMRHLIFLFPFFVRMYRMEVNTDISTKRVKVIILFKQLYWMDVRKTALSLKLRKHWLIFFLLLYASGSCHLTQLFKN